MREKPGQAIQSVASYSKNVWVRLNGGDPEDELDVYREARARSSLESPETEIVENGEGKTHLGAY